MEPGTVVAERFEIVRAVGAGGMGTVFLAKDRASGDDVALKIVSSAHDERFAREAHTLAGLAHPGIVRYVAHGSSEGGWLHLAMEWLEGEDLAQRLARAGLTVRESFEVARRAAEALAFAHAHGIVHRDVKPSNLFLEGQDTSRVKVLDFGLARWARAASHLTRSGVIVGTPAYVAPEQAGGARDIDARADVFGLGCVLFECIAGRRAFEGEQTAAVLARILFEDAPRVRSVRPEVPQAIDDLVDRMLAKDPSARPADGAAVLAELEVLAALVDGHAGSPASPQRAAISASELRFLATVLVGAPADAANAQAAAEDEAAFSAISARFGARVSRLADGSFVALVAGRDAATDQAAQGARLALAMRAARPETTIALATGRGSMGESVHLGEAVDRAAALLRDASGSGVRVDDVTARLLEARFEVKRDASGIALVDARPYEDGARYLLGKRTPCVGRDRELVTLEAIYDECVSESVARAVIVTAPPGLGKTRLRQELLRRLVARGEPLEAWRAHGDPMTAGSPLLLVGQLLRAAADLAEGAPHEALRDKLRARVGAALAPGEAERVAQVLADGVWAAPAGNANDSLFAARDGRAAMAEVVRAAFEAWLGAELARGPLLLVIDDLQWGDLPSVKLLDAALRKLADRPLMVLGLARPEVHDAFRDLWRDRHVQEIRLGPLSKKASADLVRRVLGASPSDADVASLVARAAGNAFFLEELIRASADRHDAVTLPETVLATVQLRLQALPAAERRALRAASVFGQTFWADGVAALLGGGARVAEVTEALGALRDRELVDRRGKGRFAATEEYEFHHAFVREAAYATLPREDAPGAHRHAAEWLEAAGETDPIALAEHWDRAGDASRAAWFHARAASAAAAAADFENALAHADRGVRSGAQGEMLANLHVLAATAHFWRGEHAPGEARALAALDLAPRGSASFWEAAGIALTESGCLGHTDRIVGVVREIVGNEPDEAARQEYVVRAVPPAALLFFVGEYATAEAIVDRVARIARSLPDKPLVAAHACVALGYRALFSERDPWAYLVRTREALGSPAPDAYGRARAVFLFELGRALRLIGAPREAERVLSETLARELMADFGHRRALFELQLAATWVAQDRAEEACALAREAIARLAAQNNLLSLGAARTCLASALEHLADFDQAEREARTAAETLSFARPARAHALGQLARVLLAKGRAEEALAAAREANDTLEALGAIGEGESLVRLALAECEGAVGDADGAARAIAHARARLLDRAEKIADPELRRGYLEDVPLHARTLDLAARGLTGPRRSR